MSQTVEEVSFAANGITAAGIKAFDGVLQSNIVLKTLNLSGNPIGDEGIKVSSSLLLDEYLSLHIFRESNVDSHSRLSAGNEHGIIVA